MWVAERKLSYLWWSLAEQSAIEPHSSGQHAHMTRETIAVQTSKHRSCWHNTQTKNRAQEPAAIHLSAVSITEQIHGSESCTYCIASVIQRCILSALHVWLTGCFKPLTTCWRRDVSTAGRATAGTYTAPSQWPKINTTCTTQSAISHAKGGVKWQGVTWWWSRNDWQLCHKWSKMYTKHLQKHKHWALALISAMVQSSVQHAGSSLLGSVTFSHIKLGTKQTTTWAACCHLLY